MGGGRVGYEGAAGLPAEEAYERGEVDVADRRVAVPGCRRHQALELGAAPNRDRAPCAGGAGGRPCRRR